MNRNYCTEAVVLKTRRFGDFHKSVTILSPDAGIIDAVAHGAYKGRSRISSITDPFCVSEFQLYHNPVKQQWKISGCESISLNSGIREELNAVSNASLWAELIMKTHASGADYSDVFSFFTESLAVLDRNNRLGMAVTNHFLYRFLMLSGFISDLNVCGKCGTETGGDIFFSATEGCFICGNCASAGLPVFKKIDRDYLEAYSDIALEEAVKKRLELQSERELRNTLLSVLKCVIDVPLNTLDFIDYGME